MRLLDLLNIQDAIQELLKGEVDPLLVYDLHTISEKINPHVKAYQQTAKELADEEGRIIDLNKHDELLNKEVDIQLDKVINIASLPKSLKGSIVYALMPIIYKEE